MSRIALLLLTIVTIPCFAEDLPPPESEKSRYGKIAAVVEKHAETIGCSTFFNPKDIVPYRLDHQRIYVAFYSADIGCSGGTAMSRPVFVAVKEGAYAKYFIDLKYSSPAQTSDSFPSVVTEIFVRKDELWYRARQYDFKKDANCCPSIEELGKVTFENDMWSPTTVKGSHP